MICKFFIEDLSVDDPNVMQNMKDIQDRFELLKHPNVLVLNFERFEEKIDGKPRSIYFAYRQFVYQSLMEKMRNKIPKMSMSERKWLIFQVLCGVS